MKIGELLKAAHRFHEAFGQTQDISFDMHLLKESGMALELQSFDPDILIHWDFEACYGAFYVQLTKLERLYFTLDMGENSSYLSAVVSGFVFLAVLMSLICWIFGTVAGVRMIPPNCEPNGINTCVPREPEWMENIESVCVWIFTVEILLRLLSCAQARRELLDQRYVIGVITGEGAESTPPSKNITRFFSFVLSAEALFDILSVVPFWVEMSFASTGEEISVLRVLYIARVTRVFKLGRALNADLGRFNEVHDLLRKVMINAFPAILMTVLLIITALFVFGSLIWFCERGEWVASDDGRYQALVTGDRGDEQGAWLRTSSNGLTDELSPFSSIPGAFWWTIVTITTVGYGDQVPNSFAGKVVGSVAMLYGTVILGLPLFVVGATFGQEYDRLMKAAKRRQEMQKMKDEKIPVSVGEQRTIQFAKATTNFIEEHTIFSEAAKEICPQIEIPLPICNRWQDDLKVALLDQMPAVAMDRLTIRVLTYLGEIEEMWAGASEEDAKRLEMCMKLRTCWHRLAVTCCQLGIVPTEMLSKVLDECMGVEGRVKRRALGNSVHVHSEPSSSSHHTTLKDWREHMDD